MWTRPVSRRRSTRRGLLERGLLASGFALLCLILVSLLTGCLSPTLPLPPPARPDVSPPSSSGIATVRGRVPGRTTAIAQNLDNGRLVGQVTGGDGAYVLSIEAAIGDTLVVWYRDGLDNSGQVTVTVPAESAELGPLGGAGSSD